MQKIQRFPQGFLGLIGNTSGGVTPGSVADSIVGTIDTRPFFDFNAQNRSFITGSNVFAIGVQTLTNWITAGMLADGRNVFLHGISLQIGPVAGAEAVTTRLFVGYQSAGGIPVDSERLVLGAGGAGVTGQWFDTPLQLRVTDTIAAYTEARTGATAISWGLTVLWSQY